MSSEANTSFTDELPETPSWDSVRRHLVCLNKISYKDDTGEIDIESIIDGKIGDISSYSHIDILENDDSSAEFKINERRIRLKEAVEILNQVYQQLSEQINLYDSFGASPMSAGIVRISSFKLDINPDSNLRILGQISDDKEIDLFYVKRGNSTWGEGVSLGTGEGISAILEGDHLARNPAFEALEAFFKTILKLAERLDIAERKLRIRKEQKKSLSKIKIVLE